jgi:hypothetical protein
MNLFSKIFLFLTSLTLVVFLAFPTSVYSQIRSGGQPIGGENSSAEDQEGSTLRDNTYLGLSACDPNNPSNAKLSPQDVLTGCVEALGGLITLAVIVVPILAIGVRGLKASMSTYLGEGEESSMQMVLYDAIKGIIMILLAFLLPVTLNAALVDIGFQGIMRLDPIGYNEELDQGDAPGAVILQRNIKKYKSDNGRSRLSVTGPTRETYEKIVNNPIPFEEYGLNPSFVDMAQAETIKNEIMQDEDQSWAAMYFLAYEKILDEDPELEVIPYLTTGWITLESKHIVTPYAINCDDKEHNTGLLSEVSEHCTTTNFQIAGYQASDQRRNYLFMFDKCYGSETSISSVMQRVVENSHRSPFDEWSYQSSTQKSKGLMQDFFGNIDNAQKSDISPNNDFFDRRTQFLTLVLGKDPCMVIGLNRVAVSRSDLIPALKTECAYDYFCEDSKRVLATFMQALQLFDRENPPVFSN